MLLAILFFSIDAVLIRMKASHVCLFIIAGMFNMSASGYWLGLCCLCQVLRLKDRWMKWLIFMFGILWVQSYIPLMDLVFYSRNRETKRIRNESRHGNSLAFLCQDINELEHSNQLNLPRVTVVMPLKGFGEHNLHNWRSQVWVHRWRYAYHVTNRKVLLLSLYGRSVAKILEVPHHLCPFIFSLSS